MAEQEQQQQTEERSLVALMKDFNALDELLIESGGELDPVLEQWMQLNEKNISEKVDGYKLFMDHLAAKIDFLKGMEEEIYGTRKALANQIDRMKNTLKFAAAQMQKDELLGERYRFKISESKPKLSIEDADSIPAQFMTETIVFKPDLEALQKAIDAGEVIPGVKLVTTVSLRSYVNSKGKSKKELKDVEQK